MAGVRGTDEAVRTGRGLTTVPGTGIEAVDVDRPAAILAVIVLGVVGSIVFLLLPLLVGAFTEDLALGTREIGYLGSADMVGMFLAAVVAVFWVRRVDWRLVAVLASGLLIACHLFSAFTRDLGPLLVLRTGAGFAGGSLMSIALTSLGDTRNPDRHFALFISGQLGLGALALWRLPDLLTAFGLRGAFLTLAALAFVATLAILWIPRGGQLQPAAASGPTPTRSILPGVAALAGCLAFNVGIMAVWAYMERIGDAAGLEASVIGSALGLSLLVGLFGALAAAALVDRFGRALPIGVCLALQLVALLLLSGEPSGPSFTAAVVLFSFCWNFPVAYQLSITVSVDTSSRLVVLFLSAVKLGYAIGPLLAASLLAVGGGFTEVLVAGAIGFVISAAIYIRLAGMAVSKG